MFDKEMQAALAADGEKLRAMTGQDHGPWSVDALGANGGDLPPLACDEWRLWLYEDELPEDYPYDEMFQYSRVDGVRLFPAVGNETYLIAQGGEAVQAARIIAAVAEAKKCPKCGAASGDDWRQCGGSCPMPGSPCHVPPHTAT